MSIMQRLKSESMIALKTGNKKRKDVIRYAVSQLEMSKKSDDATYTKLLQTMVSNNNSLLQYGEKVNKESITEENEILQSFMLPKMQQEMIREILTPHKEEFKDKNAGQAMNLAIKLVKSDTYLVHGNDVRAIVDELCS